MNKFKLQNFNFKSIVKSQMFKTLNNLNLIKNLKLKIKNYHATCYKLHATCSRGSALVAVLVIMAVAILVINVAVQNVLIDLNSTQNFKSSDEVYNNAISALEEAALRLNRDPTYTGGTLSFTDGNAIITIIAPNPNERRVDIVAKIRNNQYICHIQSTANYNASGILTLSAYQEIY